MLATVGDVHIRNRKGSKALVSSSRFFLVMSTEKGGMIIRGHLEAVPTSHFIGRFGLPVDN